MQILQHVDARPTNLTYESCKLFAQYFIAEASKILASNTTKKWTVSIFINLRAEKYKNIYFSFINQYKKSYIDRFIDNMIELLPNIWLMFQTNLSDYSYRLVISFLSTVDVEASMGPNGFHPKLLSSWQAVAYPIYLMFKNPLQCGQLPAQWK